MATNSVVKHDIILLGSTIQYNIRLMHRSQTATTSNMKHINIEHEIQ